MSDGIHVREDVKQLAENLTGNRLSLVDDKYEITSRGVPSFHHVDPCSSWPPRCRHLTVSASLSYPCTYLGSNETSADSLDRAREIDAIPRMKHACLSSTLTHELG